MCGICFLCFTENQGSDRILIKTSRLLNRGPDAYATHCFNCDDSACGELHGCVLMLRHHLVKQPLTDICGNSLLWNGEIFGGIQVRPTENDGSVLLNLLSEAQTDNEIFEIFGRIQGPWSFAFWQHNTQTVWFGRDIFGRRSLLWCLPQAEDDMFALSSIAIDPLQWREVPATGIYSINYSRAKRTIKLFPWQHFPACSTVEDGNSGIPSDCDHFKDSYFTFERSSSVVPVHLMPFNVAAPQEGDLYVAPVKLDSCLLSKSTIRDYRNPGDLTENKNSGSLLGQTRTRKTNTASDSVGNLDGPGTNSKEDLSRTFSCAAQKVEGKGHSDNLSEGVVDSDIHHESKSATNSTNGTEDLLSLAPNIKEKGAANHSDSSFEISSLDAKSTEIHRKKDGKKTKANKKPKQNDIQSECQMTSQDLLEMASAEQLDVAQKFLSVLGEAVRVRVQNQMEYCDACLKVQLASMTCGDGDKDSMKVETAVPDDASITGVRDVRCVHARVGVLFSGGIDSLMIAALADRFVPEDEPIDLMNVAFELQPKRETHQPGKKTRNLPSSTTEHRDPYLVPDRMTGLSGLEELVTLNPKRQWNFVEVNITVDELKRKRDEHICHLVYPLQTVLDDSIGCAVWFAARGEGIIRDPESGGTKAYRSTARVVLVGMGADEQLGGYSRHRNTFRRDGWSGLAEELRMEINRISERNLGRDDRIITDHGKESRFPFLDENVVSFLNSLPIWQKADLRQERGFGEKILLRQCAVLLGLHRAAILPKRAIQFGSRIAKVEDSKEKASDVCSRLRKVEDS
ncbi:asparagine synthetase domain-containing protein 1-like [Lineus longissimus]|uniref:asparagine synthetase domain-containing protein 1-like n=1 Tax=Lineus longissimus TaxID=88925 RepID=UPI002B4D2099